MITAMVRRRGSIGIWLKVDFALDMIPGEGWGTTWFRQYGNEWELYGFLTQLGDPKYTD